MVMGIDAVSSSLKGVETQSSKYVDGLPDGLPHHHLPLPFAYESTGTVTQFTNGLNPDARSREVFTREQLVKLAASGEFVGTFTGRHGENADCGSSLQQW